MLFTRGYPIILNELLNTRKWAFAIVCKFNHLWLIAHKINRKCSILCLIRSFLRWLYACKNRSTRLVNDIIRSKWTIQVYIVIQVKYQSTNIKHRTLFTNLKVLPKVLLTIAVTTFICMFLKSNILMSNIRSRVDEINKTFGILFKVIKMLY